jgi:hypothetical protein
MSDHADTIRVMCCPLCHRVASVAPWVKRPICVHSWQGGVPEIWDGDDPPIEQARNIEFRTPGPTTWSEMEQA